MVRRALFAIGFVFTLAFVGLHCGKSGSSSAGKSDGSISSTSTPIFAATSASRLIEAGLDGAVFSSGSTRTASAHLAGVRVFGSLIRPLV